MNFFFLMALWFVSHSSPFAQGTEITLPEIGVIGAGKGRNDSKTPNAVVISGEKLERRRSKTIGETLEREAGVAASSYGAGASRPVIRGLEGDRMRILQDGIGVLDASGTSPDHAVAFDPFAIDGVEIIRGPKALLYGNGGVGGVLNLITDRVPSRPRDRFSLLASGALSSVDRGRHAGLRTDTGTGPWALHADVSVRGTEDYAIPGGRVTNSATSAWDVSIGGGYVDTERGSFGAALSAFNTRYGSVKEPEVRIDMDRERIDAVGELRSRQDSSSWIDRVRVSGAYTFYEHQESEGGLLGTNFKNRGVESRLDIAHRPIRGVHGRFGVMAQWSKFSAEGEEAFLPTSRNSSVAGFIYEEFEVGAWTPSIGARVERSGVKIDAGASRSFTVPSAALGLSHRLSDSWSTTLNASFTERAPGSQELFSDGTHVATGTFELGDVNLPLERARSVEWSVERKETSGSIRLSAFIQDFQSFIAMSPNGDEEEGLPVFTYRAVRARILGAELEARQNLQGILPDGILELGTRADWLRGLDLSNNSNLPRMAPARIAVDAGYRTSSWRVWTELEGVFRQYSTAPNESQTAGYALWNLGSEMTLQTMWGELRIGVRLLNALDQLGRNHVSLVKDIAPLPGRSFILTAQFAI